MYPSLGDDTFLKTFFSNAGFGVKSVEGAGRFVFELDKRVGILGDDGVECIGRGVLGSAWEDSPLDCGLTTGILPDCCLIVGILPGCRFNIGMPPDC